MGTADRIARKLTDAVLDRVASQSRPKVIVAYHGSPRPTHFDRFDASRIGTGEGAQAYGYGHYFAQIPEVAAGYRRALSLRKLKDDFLRILPQDATAEEVMEFLGQFDPRQREMLTALAADDWLGFDYPSQAISQTMAPSGLRPYPDASNDLAASRASLGTGYQVEIGAPEESLLNWDRPTAPAGGVGARAAEVLRSVRPSEISPSALSYIRRMRPGEYVKPAAGSELDNVERALQGLARDAEGAVELLDAGIPGVRYLDGASRSQGEGTRNYVMFPGTEDRISILRKYGLLGPAAAGMLGDEE